MGFLASLIDLFRVMVCGFCNHRNFSTIATGNGFNARTGIFLAPTASSVTMNEGLKPKGLFAPIFSRKTFSNSGITSPARGQPRRKAKLEKHRAERSVILPCDRT
jgi:hypothetical protein